MPTTLMGRGKPVVVDPDGPFVIVGEKINPTGSKKLSAALEAGCLDYVRELAHRQVASGADVLDINVGVAGGDEPALMAQVVQVVSEALDVPLCLDSASPQTLAAGLAAAPGKPLVNSVTAETERLETILPLVKDRGAAVIGLIMNDAGIPATPEGRLAAAEAILERACRIGLPAEDVIFDPLAMAVSADSQAGLVTLRTIDLIHRQLGANVILGASNVSHGLPDRPTVNAIFLAMAISAGATCAIADPHKLSSAIRAADLLRGRDDYGIRYIRHYKKMKTLAEQTAAA